MNGHSWQYGYWQIHRMYASGRVRKEGKAVDVARSASMSLTATRWVMGVVRQKEMEEGLLTIAMGYVASRRG